MTCQLIPLSHPHSMTFQHVLPLGPCIYLGHINTVLICTISLKLVLTLSLLAIHSRYLSSPLRGILICKLFAIRACIVLGCQYNGLVIARLISSQSPIGRTSVSSRVLPTQEVGRKEYIHVRLASITKELAFPLSSSVTKGPSVTSSNRHVKPTACCSCCPFCCQHEDH